MIDFDANLIIEPQIWARLKECPDAKSFWSTVRIAMNELIADTSLA